jgi:hypothetical protein
MLWQVVLEVHLIVLHARMSWMIILLKEQTEVKLKEADTGIIPYAMRAVRSDSQRIVVLFGDTDVCVLFMHYWDILHSEGLRELWIRACVGDSKRYLPVHIRAPRVGKGLWYLLPLAHTLTG